jgi:hypothetical protein
MIPGELDPRTVAMALRNGSKTAPVGVIYSPATANLPTLETASIGRSGRIQ